MKTKNIFKALAMAMLLPAMLLTTACSNDDFTANNDNNVTTAKQGYTLPVTVNVTREGDATMRATYTDNGNGTGSLGFSSGDKLLVRGADNGFDKFAGILTWQSGGTFSGTITTENTSYTGTADDLLKNAISSQANLLPAGYDSEGFIKVSGSGYQLNISYDWTKAFALTKAEAVEQLSREYAGSYSSGTGFALAPLGFILNFTITGLTPSTEVAVAFTKGPTSTSGNVTTDGSGNATFAISTNSTSIGSCTLTVGGNDIALPSTSLKAGKIYNITRSAIPGALIGQFSVSDTKKVYFSKGNLQATYNTSWSWAFATNQWDYIGNAAGNTSINGVGTISGTGTVDLFGWVGAACAWTGAAQYGISNVAQAKQYGNVAGEALKSDWGTLAITNGGNTANFGWRTLTSGDDSGEWDYLFKTRTTPSGVRYAHATVNSVPGLVLLPDDWSTDYYSLNKVNDATGTAYTDNVISSSDWTSKLEAHGAVFLPAGGYRGGTDGATVSDAGNRGNYWSSTSSTSEQSARYFFFGSAVFWGNTSNSTRNRGCSVRLVYDAN